MGWEAWFMLGLTGAVFAGLILHKPPDAVLLGAVVIAATAGILPLEDAFSGFANTGMLTVAALFVVTAGLRETGALDMIGRWLLGGVRSETGVMARLAVAVTGMSAFLNNTPIVAMFIPILSNWCRQNRVAPSRLLLPLSYISIFGGTCTLIGTSTNLVVNGLMQQRQGEIPELRPMSLFEIGQVGLPYAVLALLYVFFLGRRFLPKHGSVMTTDPESARSYLVNVQVMPGCRLIGKTVEEADLRHLPGLYLIEIERGGVAIAPVGPQVRLEEGDTLTFTGAIDTIVDLERIPGIEPVGDDGYESASQRRRWSMLSEAVLSPTAPVIGRSIRANNFRARYNAAVVAVHRGGARLQGKVGDIVLRSGDTLLLQADPHFGRAQRDNPDFYLVSSVEESRPVRHDKAFISLALLGVLLVLMATRVVPIVLAAFLVAGAMIGFRCVFTSDARRTIDYRTLVTIGAAFGFGGALDASGLVDAAASEIVGTAGRWGPVAVLASVFLLTSIFTEIVTNNAAAALMFPFAVAIAQQLGVNPRPFVIAVAFAASASFITPLGYQTNLMVFGPGGYKFTDYVRVGLPLNLLVLVVGTLLIPRVWPF